MRRKVEEWKASERAGSVCILTALIILDRENGECKINFCCCCCLTLFFLRFLCLNFHLPWRSSSPKLAWSIYVLNDGHRGTVSLSIADAKDSGVPAIALRVPRPELRKKFRHGILRRQVCKRLPSGMQVILPALRQRHHLVRDAPQLLGPRHRRLDSLKLDQGRRQIPEHRPAVLRRPP